MKMKTARLIAEIYVARRILIPMLTSIGLCFTILYSYADGCTKCEHVDGPGGDGYTCAGIPKCNTTEEADTCAWCNNVMVRVTCTEPGSQPKTKGPYWECMPLTTSGCGGVIGNSEGGGFDCHPDGQ